MIDEPDETTATIEPPPAETTPPEESPSSFKGLGDALKSATPGLTEEATHDTSKYVKKSGAETPDAIERDEDGKFKPKTTALTQKGEEKPIEVEKKPEEAKPVERDTDLSLEIDQTVRPKVKKIIEGMKSQAIAARNERDAEKAAKVALESKLQELETKLKTQVAPKAVEDELATLRTRVRELDISKDPALETKYDAVIKKNSASALELLKEQGLFTRMAETGKPPVEMNESEKKAITAEIEKAGTGLRGMAKYIRALEQGGEYEAAERLRALAQHNDRLSTEKSEEIGKWSKDYEGFQASRTREQQQQQEAYQTAVKSHGEKTLQADLTELQKQLPFLNRPAEVLPTDTPEVKAAKQKEISEYDSAIASLQAGAKAFNTEGLPPEKAAEINGRMTASAIQSLILKGHVIPRLLKDAGVKDARIKELETEVSKIRKAGSINRAHSAALSAPEQNKRAPDPNLSLADALRQTMRANGGATD